MIPYSYRYYLENTTNVLTAETVKITENIRFEALSSIYRTELHELITPIPTKTQRTPDILTASDMENLRNLALLKPLEYMTKKRSGEKYHS